MPDDDAPAEATPAADAGTDAAPEASPADALDAVSTELLEQFRAELGDALVEDGVSFGDAVFHRSRLAGLLRQRVEAGDSVI